MAREVGEPVAIPSRTAPAVNSSWEQPLTPPTPRVDHRQPPATSRGSDVAVHHVTDRSRSNRELPAEVPTMLEETEVVDLGRQEETDDQRAPRLPASCQCSASSGRCVAANLSFQLPQIDQLGLDLDDKKDARPRIERENVDDPAGGALADSDLGCDGVPEPRQSTDHIADAPRMRVIADDLVARWKADPHLELAAEPSDDRGRTTDREIRQAGELETGEGRLADADLPRKAHLAQAHRHPCPADVGRDSSEHARRRCVDPRHAASVAYGAHPRITGRCTT